MGGFNANVDRLKAYKAQLIIFPNKKGGKSSQAESESGYIAAASAEECAAVDAVDTRTNVFPLPTPEQDPEFATITSDMRRSFMRETMDGEKGTAYEKLRHTWATAHNVGRKHKKKKEEGKKKKKK